MQNLHTTSTPAKSSLHPGPVAARVLPFITYVVFMVLEDPLKPYIDPTVFYGLQIGVTVLLLAWGWQAYSELNRAPRLLSFNLLWASLVGVLVYFAWINLDADWMRFGEGREITATLSGDNATWPSLLLRAIGAVLVVPLMEELFWRSFLLRWIDRPRFYTLPPTSISWRAVIIGAALFGAEHDLWLAGIVAGIAFGALYRRTGSLWTVVAAHALTNALLENWWGRGSWPFI
jgi:uncharacterized protein